jgi:hypothetical protein
VAEDLGAARRRPYGLHFGVAYFVLAAILGASVGTFIVLLGRNTPPKTEWSAWAPNGSVGERVSKITEHVAPKYRLPSGNQLVGVIPQPPSVERDGQRLPIRAFGFADRQVSNGLPDVTFRPTDDAVEYILCGVPGKGCAIPEGTPSLERTRLLRREALELALYTFRYVDGVNAVFAMLPPKEGNPPSFGLYFEKSDLAEELKHPLRRTLPQPAPLTVDRLTTIEKTVVDRLTVGNIFQFQYQQISDGSWVLVLAPPSAT